MSWSSIWRRSRRFWITPFVTLVVNAHCCNSVVCNSVVWGPLVSSVCRLNIWASSAKLRSQILAVYAACCMQATPCCRWCGTAQVQQGNARRTVRPALKSIPRPARGSPRLSAPHSAALPQNNVPMAAVRGRGPHAALLLLLLLLLGCCGGLRVTCAVSIDTPEQLFAALSRAAEPGAPQSAELQVTADVVLSPGEAAGYTLPFVIPANHTLTLRGGGFSAVLRLSALCVATSHLYQVLRGQGNASARPHQPADQPDAQSRRRRGGSSALARSMDCCISRLAAS